MDDPLSQLGLRFAGLTPQTETPAAHVYAGQDFAGVDLTLAVLTESAAADPTVRHAFADLVNRHRGGSGPGQPSIHSADLDSARPWVAVRSGPDQPDAVQLLTALGGPAAGGPAPATGPPPLPATVPAWPAPDPTISAWPAPDPTAFGAPPPPPAASPAPGTPAPPATYVPAAPATPYPPQAPARPSGQPGLVLAVLVAVGVLVACGAVAAYTLSRPQAADPGQAAQEPPEVEEEPGPPPPPAVPDDVERPELREVPPLVVLGPSWEPDDDTYTMAFPQMPFAFRTPGDWDCISGTHPAVPEAVAIQCLPLSDPDRGQRVNLVLEECPAPCAEAEQEALMEIWLDQPDQVVAAADVPFTWYVEQQENPRGQYDIDLSHFFGDPADPDAPLSWHLGVYLESPLETRDDVLRTLNDIITQASG